MTKLAEALALFETGKKRAGHFPIEVDTTSTGPSMIFAHTREYALTATFQARGYLATGEDVAPFMRAMRRQITEGVFGEFRPMLLQIERALWDHDIEKARGLVASLSAHMFSE